MPVSRVRARTDRERQIVAATRALFDERGAQEAGIDGIARAVGINKALIYRHFASKEELFVLTLTSYLADLRDRYVPLTADLTDPVEVLRRGIDRYAEFCLEHPAFLDCALSLMRRPAAELEERVSEGVWLRLGRGMGDCLAPLARVLAAGRDTGAFALDDPDYVANRIYVQVLGTMHLARVGVGVRRAEGGVPVVFPVDPEQV